MGDIDNISVKIGMIVDSFGEVNKSISDVLINITDQNNQTQVLSKNADEIGRKFGEMVITISDMNDAVSESSKSISDLAKTSENLTELATNMNASVKKFHF